MRVFTLPIAFHAFIVLLGVFIALHTKVFPGKGLLISATVIISIAYTTYVISQRVKSEFESRMRSILQSTADVLKISEDLQTYARNLERQGVLMAEYYRKIGELAVAVDAVKDSTSQDGGGNDGQLS